MGEKSHGCQDGEVYWQTHAINAYGDPGSKFRSVSNREASDDAQSQNIVNEYP